MTSTVELPMQRGFLVSVGDEGEVPMRLSRQLKHEPLLHGRAVLKTLPVRPTQLDNLCRRVVNGKKLDDDALRQLISRFFARNAVQVLAFILTDERYRHERDPSRTPWSVLSDENVGLFPDLIGIWTTHGDQVRLRWSREHTTTKH